ncbi:nucleotide exchange factor GrpE [Nakamurella leprariae]|uniref:Nucleotide exchange factor GrpE n=1 Tax=Nakamurella leprariae TaxID=2803911 RepID=A0A938YHX3_9ACTN|nr:nucleotide exchange factor GrpE [Nakamurella leprariae]MBM9468652.1 nucleotide exchange factor GrpE [Nakamurella leprariae]
MTARRWGIVFAAVLVLVAAATAAWMAAPPEWSPAWLTFPSSTWGGRPAVAALVVLVAAAVMVAAMSVARRWTRAGRRPAERTAGPLTPAAAPDPPSRPTSAPVAPDGVDQRPPGLRAEDPDIRRLIESVIGVRDLVPSQALAERLGAGLAAVGVQTDHPLGRPFDPARHQAVETVVTDDPRLADTIAAVERVGYSQDGRELRPAEVVVYRAAR